MSLESLREIFTSFGDSIRAFFKEWHHSVQEEIGFEYMWEKRYSLSEMKSIWENFRNYGHNLNFLMGFTNDGTNKAYTNEEDLYTLCLPKSTRGYNFTFAHQWRNSGLKKLCGNITSIPDYFCNNNRTIEEIDFPELTNISQGAFEEAGKLKKVNLPKLQYVSAQGFKKADKLEEIDLSNVTIIDSEAFAYTALAEINIPKWSFDYDSLTYQGYGQFSNNLKLTTVNWGESKSDIPSSCFSGCTGLKTFYKGGWTQYVGPAAFKGCSSLEQISLYFCHKIYAEAFMNCSSLTILHLSQNIVIPLENSNALKGTPIANGTGYIYVDSRLINEYKTAANWSLYADQFKTIEELPWMQAGE